MKTSLKIMSDDSNYDPSPIVAKNEKEAIKLLKEGKFVENLYDFSDSKKVMLLAVKRNGDNLRLVSPNLRKDKKIVLAAVANDGLAIAYADPMYFSDMDVALVAVVNNGLAIKYIDSILTKDTNLVMTALTSSNGELILKYIPHKEIRSSLEIGLLAINSNYKEAEYLDKSLYYNDVFRNSLTRLLKAKYNIADEEEQVEIKRLLKELSYYDGEPVVHVEQTRNRELQLTI